MTTGLLPSLSATEMWNGLERFHEFQLSPILWDRFRLDDTYAKANVLEMFLSNRRLAGEKFETIMDRSRSRADLMKTLKRCGYDLDDPLEDFLSLDPKTVYPHAGQGLLDSGIHDEKITLVLVDPKRSLSETEARQELWLRGLEPPQVEEGLDFGLVMHSESAIRTRSVVVLDAYTPSPRKFLTYYATSDRDDPTWRHVCLELPNPRFTGAPSFLGRPLPPACIEFQEQFFRGMCEGIGASKRDEYFSRFCREHAEVCSRCAPFIRSR